MKRIRMLAMAGAVAIGGAMASPLDAQERRPDPIPDAYKPPAGMCRIWVDGVPANRQPAPTDCASAVKNRPANGRVIFGERAQGAAAEPFLRSFGGKEKPRPAPKPKVEKPQRRESRPETPRRRP